ncbi:MAG: hypothetical protein JO353_09365, partial [Phycisphaerae bacterium]|nr:hypothetical protein [Phycisphaerae bacterium]
EPGQFIQIACRDASSSANVHVAEWSDESAAWPAIEDSDLRARQAVLRRPFSLAGREDRADGVVLSIIHRVIGVGTDWLAKLSAGDSVDLIGPLGNRFPKPPSNFGIFIGGGVGIPPLLYLAQRWRSLQLLAFCGATTRDLLPLTIIPAEQLDPAEPVMGIDELARHGVASVISTDDGSFGFRGLVTNALEAYLDRALPGMNECDRPVLYTCGPEGMMKRVAAIAHERQLDCYVAVERAMACGMGTCQSCVIRVRKGDDWRYALSCTEGPILRGSDLLW